MAWSEPRKQDSKDLKPCEQMYQGGLVLLAHTKKTRAFSQRDAAGSQVTTSESAVRATYARSEMRVHDQLLPTQF